jgi:hypothetical protein
MADGRMGRFSSASKKHVTEMFGSAWICIHIQTNLNESAALIEVIGEKSA